MSRIQQRVSRLRKLIRRTGAHSLLITNFANVTYLTGFTGDDSYLLVTPDIEVLLTDPRYTTQLEKECPDLELEVRRPGQSILDVLAKLIKKARLSDLAIEGGSMTVGQYDAIRSKLERVEFAPTDGLIEQLRVIKDKDEVAEIRQAVRIAQQAFGVIRASLRGEMTEKNVHDQMEYQVRLFGGKCCSFPPIVAAGPRAALPHAQPTDEPIGEHDFLLIDWGAQGRLYTSDLTRVLVTGKISPKLERIYGVVLKAQLQAMAAIKPGVSLGDVDSAARSVIAKAGFGKNFGHGLGHGIGLEIHESPRLAAGQSACLQAGMVVTVEPGIYLPGWGGVRIEDDVLVTRSGHEVLSSVPKELEACVIV